MGVNGLFLVDPSAWNNVYGNGHAEVRKYFLPDAVNPNQIIAADSTAMLPAFSGEVLAQQKRLTRAYNDLLMQRLAKCAQSDN